MRKLYILGVAVLSLLLWGVTPAFAAKTVRIAYVEWPCAVASSNLAKAVLEDRLGCTVELIPVSAAVMWQAIALGEADASVTAWLPSTHASYLESTGDKLENLGPLVGGAKLGWVVPNYVSVTSIEQLKGQEERFKGRIYGIDPGSGLMLLSEKALKDYELSGYTLMEGSDATMVGALDDAVKRQEWIVLTSWSPHWMFGRWQLKYLDDPKKSLGGEESINTIVRKGLKEDMPEVHAFFDKFSLKNTAQLERLMAANESGKPPLESAKEFMRDNKQQVDDWLK